MNLLIHQAALGDWVLTFPILRSLASPTIVVTAGEKARLAARVVPGVTPLDIEHHGWSRLHIRGSPSEPGRVAPTSPSALHDEIPSSLRDTLASIDGLLISFVSNGRDAWAENARRLAPLAKLAFVEPRPLAEWASHVTEWHRHQLAAQGVELPRVEVEPRSNPAGPIVLHPGSGGREKCWPLERFESLIEALRSQGLGVRPILGEVELDRWPPGDVTRWRERYGAATIPSLDTLADAIAGARLFIGNDSGPTHLAAQMGVATLALFGPTLPAVWRPIGPQAQVHAPPQPALMEWLSIAEVLRHCD